MNHSLDAPVVVVTGASSGIGRATALAFARKHARLALVAREASALEAAARQCRAVGAQVLVCLADVVELAEVEEVRARVVTAYGRIDVWVNCAAVLLFGRFEEVPADAFKRVIATNLMGCVNGARAALKQFGAQDHRGVLVNTGSLLGTISEPYVSAYVASKFAIRGFSACLRQEYRNAPGIRICLVMPPAVDTPIYGKAGNFLGRQARSIFPTLAADRVARTIVDLSEHPRAEAVVGLSGHLLKVCATLAPRLLERAIGRVGPALQFKREPQPPTAGNLFAGKGPHAISGGWKQYWHEKIGLRRSGKG